MIYDIQAEFEELANRAETLNEENTSLRTELNRIKSEYEHLLSENNSLKVMIPLLAWNRKLYLAISCQCSVWLQFCRRNLVKYKRRHKNQVLKEMTNLWGKRIQNETWILITSKETISMQITSKLLLNEIRD